MSHEYTKDTQITDTPQERPKWESAQATSSVPGKELKESKPPPLAEMRSGRKLRKLGVKLGVQLPLVHPLVSDKGTGPGTQGCLHD